MDQDLVNFQFSRTSSNIIKVIGVGGAGCNAVNHMFEEGIMGVDYIVCNTDLQALLKSPVAEKIQLGATLTNGLGAGNDPKKGEESAVESSAAIREILQDNTKMVFITAGMGGGTGTGAAPVIAKIARELEYEKAKENKKFRILTIAVVTLASQNEGRKRFEQAKEGIEKLREYVDSMLIVNNDQLHRKYGDLPASSALKLADNIVTTAVKGVAEIITVPGNINIDFADVFTVMAESRVFVMGTGYGSGETRATDAVDQALEFPLLDSNDIKGAKNILVNIISGNDEIKMGEIGQILDKLQKMAGEGAEIIWGNGKDESLGDEISVTILATGFINNPNQHFQEKAPVEFFHIPEQEEEKAGHFVNQTIHNKSNEPVFEISQSSDDMKRDVKPQPVKRDPFLDMKTSVKPLPSKPKSGWLSRQIDIIFSDDSNESNDSFTSQKIT